jgi:hypothetical protein
MKGRAVASAIPAFTVFAVPAALPAMAEQVTGVSGSPGATTTIDGKQLPPPDPKFGGVIQSIDDMGKLDNTLIIYISGDNCGSDEGTLVGTPNEVAMFNGVDVPVKDQLKYFYDIWGTDETYPHMAVAWSWELYDVRKDRTEANNIAAAQNHGGQVSVHLYRCADQRHRQQDGRIEHRRRREGRR